MKTVDLAPNDVLRGLIDPAITENRLVFIDGALSAAHSARPDAALSLETGPAGEIRVSVPDKASIATPVRLLFVTAPGAKSAAFAHRVDVRAGISSRLHLILDLVDLGPEASERRIEAEVRLAPNACVRYVELVRGGTGARHLSKNRFLLDRHADLDAFAFSDGGAQTSFESVVDLEAEHAFASVKGLAVLGGDSRAQSRVIADHKVGHGTSRQLFKSILADRSRSEVDSLVAIRRGAAKSDSQQLMRSLLLSEKAESQVRPELRIDADDVSAQHGASTGRLEKNELFYLQSRGFSEALARYVLTLGFADELLAQIEPEPLREALRGRVRASLRRALGFSGQEV